MRNSNPKSEMPAMKENATKDKDRQARQKSTDQERVGKIRGARQAKNKGKK
jgi:hypothetical protein